METKICTSCNVRFPATLEFFYRNKNRCKKCECAWQKEYRIKNKKRVLEQKKDYYSRHQQKIVEQKRQYRKDNREKVSVSKKKYYQKNKENIILKEKENYKEQVEKMPAGIYMIRNKKTLEVYVGASTMLPRRWREHKYRLSKKNHSNPSLQKSYDEYGLQAFEFIILEEYPHNVEFKFLEKIEREEITKRLSEGQQLYNKK